MYSVLDITGAFLYVIYRIIMLPLQIVLHAFFAVWDTFTLINAGINWVRNIRIHPLQPFYHFAKYRLHLGRRLYAWALHRG